MSVKCINKCKTFPKSRKKVVLFVLTTHFPLFSSCFLSILQNVITFKMYDLI